MVFGVWCVLCFRVFDECRQRLDLRTLLRNCRFDVCEMETEDWACSTLEQAAEECMRIGICVDWRGHTNGTCGKQPLLVII